MGIDASEEAISVAQHHAKHDPDVRERVNYRCTTAEDLVDESDGFDAVVASEVIEHVGNQEFFVETCAQLTKVNAYDYKPHQKFEFGYNLSSIMSCSQEWKI